MIVTLADKHDVYKFTVGTPLVESRRWRRLSAAWRRITWWRQPHMMTTAIDVETGSITVASLAWSWRRWRWEIQR